MSIIAFTIFALTFAADSPWKYTADASQRNDLFFLSVPLGNEPPADVKVELKWTGVRKHFGQLRYGTGDSVRIAIAVDEKADGSADVYVDADRTRTLTPAMKLNQAGPTWTTTLTANDANKEAARTALLHWGPKAKVLGVATLGAVEGTTKIGEREVRCQVVDGDANGLFSDAKDVLRVDLNGDGKFDLFQEQFRLRPLMTFGKDRWIVRGKPLDGRIVFSPLQGLGKIKLDLPAWLPKNLEAVAVQLASSDGVSIVLTKPQQVIEAPPGAYAVVAVNFIVPSTDGRRWKYAFYKDYGAKPIRFNVGVAKETNVDPIGRLEFGVHTPTDAENLKPSQEILLQPTWKSTTGLQINSVHFGEENVERNQPHAVVELKRADGKVVGRERSGFF